VLYFTLLLPTAVTYTYKTKGDPVGVGVDVTKFIFRQPASVITEHPVSPIYGILKPAGVSIEDESVFVSSSYLKIGHP